MKAVIIHQAGGGTKVAAFESPIVSMQMADGGIHVVLYNEHGGQSIGVGMFTSGGVVGLAGVAVEQYTALTKPEVTG